MSQFIVGGTGDNGSTSLYNGRRVRKSNQTIRALGKLDTACVAIGALHESIKNDQKRLHNSSSLWTIVAVVSCLTTIALRNQVGWNLGLALVTIATAVRSIRATKESSAFLRSTKADCNLLELIMCAIFDANSNIATPEDDDQTKERQLRRVHFNHTPDHIERRILFLHERLPKLRNFILPVTSTPAHFARVFVREAETILESDLDGECQKTEILAYINRISRYMFQLGRWLAYLKNEDEVPYQK